MPSRDIFSYRPLREMPSRLAVRVLLPRVIFRVSAMSLVSISFRVEPAVESGSAGLPRRPARPRRCA